MPLSKQDVLTDLDAVRWTTETMAVAVAGKKEKRNQRGQAFHMYVLDRQHYPSSDDSAEEEQESVDELDVFLRELKKNIDNNEPEPGTRFQVLVSNQDHWTPYDITVGENKRLTIVGVDAAQDMRGGRNLDQMKEAFPDADVYYFKADTFFDEEKGMERERFMQFDDDSCGQFALDYAFHFQNVDMVSVIPAAKSREIAGINMISPNDFPKELAVVFRDTQSWKVLDTISEELSDTVINKKQETMKGSARRHSVTLDGKMVNKAIDHKRKRFSTNTLNLLRNITTENLVDIIDNRQGYDYLQMNAEDRHAADREQITRFPQQEVIRHHVQDHINTLTAKAKAANNPIKKAKLTRQIKQYTSLLDDLPQNKLLSASELAGTVRKITKIDKNLGQKVHAIGDLYRSSQAEQGREIPTTSKSSAPAKPSSPSGRLLPQAKQVSPPASSLGTSITSTVTAHERASASAPTQGAGSGSAKLSEFTQKSGLK